MVPAGRGARAVLVALVFWNGLAWSGLLIEWYWVVPTLARSPELPPAEIRNAALAALAVAAIAAALAWRGTATATRRAVRIGIALLLSAATLHVAVRAFAVALAS